MNLDELQAYMDASPFIHGTGMRVTVADHESEMLTMTMPLKPEFERGAGTGQFHGGSDRRAHRYGGLFRPS